MPRDNEPDAPHRLAFRAVAGEAPVDWCRAISTDEPSAADTWRPAEQAGTLPPSDDLLGWSVILLTAPPLLAGIAALIWYCCDQLI